MRALQSLVHRLALPILLCTGSADAERYVRIAAEVQITETTSKRARNTAGRTSAGADIRTNQWAVHFVCTVGTNEWQLDGDFSRNARRKWFYDGTNLSESAHILSPPRNLGTNGNGDSAVRFDMEIAKSNLTVHIHDTEGGYPPSDVGVNIPWLAFCSGTYLKTANRVIPLPVAIIGHAPDVFAYTDRTETFEDELGLPRRIELFHSELRYESSARLFWKNMPLQSRMLRSGFRDGVRKFHYETTQSTNFMGWNIPLKFEFAEDTPEAFSDAHLRNLRGSGIVTAIAASSKPEGVFDLSLRQTVVDWRFHHETKEVNAIVYPWTNSFVPPTNDALLQAAFERRVKRAPDSFYLRRGRTRRVLWVLMGVATLIPITLLFFRNNPKNNKNQIQKL